MGANTPCQKIFGDPVMCVNHDVTLSLKAAISV